MSRCSSALMDSSGDPRRVGTDHPGTHIDLRLRLSISPTSSSSASSSTCCEDYKRPAPAATATATKLGESWPPIKGVLRSALAGSGPCARATLYVKVYLEGVPIGRKLDLLAHGGYGDLAAELYRMFGTDILLGRRPDQPENVSNKHHQHLLTYEDREGDWMMVGDVPWRMFLSSVKRLKIVRADRCLLASETRN